MRIIYRIKQHSLIWQNLYFILGMLLGFSLLMFIPEGPWSEVIENCQDSPFSSNLKDGHDFEPKLNLVNKPMAAKKIIKNILLPRYYSSELGIREKVFVGVLTSQKRINTLATAFNKTTAHLVNKIKFFINADNVKSNFKLKNIVGFTDTRENLRPSEPICVSRNVFNASGQLCRYFSFEVMKPLRQIEIIPSPYVTESTRIALFLPIFVHQVSETIDFIKRYEKKVHGKLRQHLFNVFLYEMNSANKGIEDVFYSLKSIALSLSEKYKSDNSRIAWVSIRLPEPEVFGGGLGAMPNNMLPSMYGEHEILSLVVTDLALRKIGLDSLVMICSNKMSFKAD